MSQIPPKLVFEEVIRRKESRGDLGEFLARVQSPEFPKQNAFVLDQSRFIDAQCSRRAGKSNGLALRYFRTLKKYPRCFCPYIALTRESAKNIMWGILQEQNERFQIGAEFTESNLTMTMPNGARLQLFGADMKNFIRRLKGVKSPGVGVDEAQDFGSHLEELVESVLEPTISDYPDGWIAITGTPGPVPVGFFYEITEQRKRGYSFHDWTLYDNPYMPNAREFVEDLKRRKGWDESNPTLQREWRNRWVLDMDALVFKYQAERNDYAALPALDRGWEYVIGVDIGFDDADAIAVLGWHPKLKETYLIEEFQAPSQGITELAQEIEKRIRKYNPLKVVMDTGGLGKKIAEEIRRRYTLPISAAEKDRKFEFIELLNDAMRTRRFFAKRQSLFAQDAMRVKWDLDSHVLKISDNFHSDICDAVLYAFREALHWLYEPEEPKVTVGTPEWVRKQEEEMERIAQENLRRSQEDDGWGWSE